MANFDRMANFVEELQASAYYYGQVFGFGTDSMLKSVEATDDMTVIFTLSRPTDLPVRTGSAVLRHRQPGSARVDQRR